MKCSMCGSYSDKVVWGDIPMEPVCDDHIKKNGHVYMLTVDGARFYIDGVPSRRTGGPISIESLEKLTSL